MRITRTSLALGVAALALAACKDGTGPNTPPGVIAVNVGESRTLSASQSATIEVSGGSGGGEFVLIPFNGSQTAADQVTLEFTGTQITSVSGPPTPQAGPAGQPLLSLGSSKDFLRSAGRFDLGLRRLERDVFGRWLAARRAAGGSRLSPLRSVTGAAAAVPNVGDAVTLNTAARGQGSACDVPDNRNGRVVAVTAHTVIVADNANPAGGFTDAEYLEIAQEYDALVYPTITQNFGVPADIDENGPRSVIFYTRAVNELTPSGGEAVTGGFFHPRDLFPRTTTDPNLFACPTSNVAEIFYMLVPDPNGEVNNNIRTKAAVRRQTVGVLAHEFQHLINGSRALYVNDAESFEEAWLNEGLSHIAEELMFYRVSGLAPKQNITLATLQSSQTILDAVNAYQVSNIGRLIEYLEDPERRSPYTALTAETDPIDDLATRGAAWQLLRYAADRSTTAQQTIWMALANAKVKGIPNFTAVFGGPFLDLVRDWTVAQYADDAVANIPAQFRHPSWHYRSVVPALLDPRRFPLKTRTMTAGTQVSLTLNGGSPAYLRFGIAGGATAKITATSTGQALPPRVSVTVMRTK